MGRVRTRSFNRGLWLNVPPEQIPEGGMRRAKGIDPVKTVSVRSRKGSTAVLAQVAHSLYRFDDRRFAGTATQLLRDGSTITSLADGLAGATDPLANFDGTRLAFANMQVGLAVEDQLFVAGGGAVFPASPIGGQGLPTQLCKVDKAGIATRWGITTAAPNALSGFAVVDQGTGNLLAGTYQWQATMLNNNTGSRSNPQGGGNITVTITAAQAPANVELTGSFSRDPQITHQEWWRTVTNGAVKFFVGKQAVTVAQVSGGGAGVPAFEDNVTDDALGEELRFDNGHPESTYEDCVGPHVGRMWWGRINKDGERGRVIYSPIGLPESAAGGFLELASDDEQIQKLVAWNGSLWAFSEKWLYEIVGFDEPFRFRQVQGIPGTIAPFTAVGTPYGLVWMAQSGVQVFNGAQGRLIGFEAMGRLFRGDAVEGKAAFEGVVAAEVRGEYVISNNVDTYGLELVSETWREIGVAMDSLYWEHDTDKLIVSNTGLAKVVIHEDEAVLTDDGAAIPFEIETPHALVDGGQTGFVQRIYLDADLAGQTLTPAVVLDGVAVAKPTVTNASRGKIEIPIGRQVREVGVRFTGTVTAQVEIFGIEFDVRPSEVVA